MQPPYTIAIRLIPKASVARVGEIRMLANGQEQLVLYVNEPPDKGKANNAMIKLLAEHLHIPTSRISIIKGQTCRDKLVKIE